MPTAGAGRVCVGANQLESRLKSAANWSPVTTTFCDEPTRVIDRTRPPRSPKPLREVIEIDSKVPSWGKVASMEETGTEAVHVWLVLQAPFTPGGQTESPASGTAGKVPGAV